MNGLRGRKKIADKVSRITMADLRKEGFLSGKDSGALTCKKPYFGATTFTIGNMFINIPEDEDPEEQKEPAEGWVEFKAAMESWVDGKELRFGEDQMLNQSVAITSTPCNYGRGRFWFKCPGKRDDKWCRKRVGILFLVDGRFGCRECHNLTYKSQNLAKKSRTHGKIVPIGVLEDMWSQVKRFSYNGKLTKKYARVIRKQEQHEAAFKLQTGIALKPHKEFLKKFRHAQKNGLR